MPLISGAFIQEQLVMMSNIYAVVILALLSSSALAEKLPADANPLTSADVKALYAGKSADWSTTRAYFAPNGKFLTVAKDGSWFNENGEWTVKGNKICATSRWKDEKTGQNKSSNDCWTWFKVGPKYLSLWSGEKNNVNGYYAKELDKMVAGDEVSPVVAKLKK